MYREWTANDTVIVRTARRTTASVAYVIRKGERITALTGIVTTVKAGRVRFRNTVNLQTASGALHVERGQTGWTDQPARFDGKDSLGK